MNLQKCRFYWKFVEIKFTEDQIDNAINLSSFDKLEKMERVHGFTRKHYR